MYRSITTACKGDQLAGLSTVTEKGLTRRPKYENEDIKINWAATRYIGKTNTIPDVNMDKSVNIRLDEYFKLIIQDSMRGSSGSNLRYVLISNSNPAVAQVSIDKTRLKVQDGDASGNCEIVLKAFNDFTYCLDTIAVFSSDTEVQK